MNSESTLTRISPLFYSFRKWEAYNLACIYYEKNRNRSVNDTRNWLDDRVPRLESQNTNLNKCLQESKWSNSVLAKEVRGIYLFEASTRRATKASNPDALVALD